MLINCALWLNIFPPKDIFSKSDIPCTIFTGVKFDYNKHCQLQFNQYSQVLQENTPTNSQAVRTSGSIFLGPAGNIEGG